MAAAVLKSHKTFEGLTQFWSHFSTENKCEMKFATFIPKGPVKGCVIWLSGLTATEENFITKAGAQKYLAQHNLMVIAPDTSPRELNLPGENDSENFGTGASMYVDATTPDYRTNYHMFSYVANELYFVIQNEFKVSNISIMGQSMGGHGALTIGLNHPEKFKVVSAFAPLCHPVKSVWTAAALKGYLGDDIEAWKKYDATELILAGKKHSVPILIHIGTVDEYLKKSILPDYFIEACKLKNQPLEFNWAEGYDHSYYFVSTFIEQHVKYHAQFLK